MNLQFEKHEDLPSSQGEVKESKSSSIANSRDVVNLSKGAYCKMKSMIPISKSLVVFTKLLHVAFTRRNTECEHTCPTK